MIDQNDQNDLPSSFDDLDAQQDMPDGQDPVKQQSFKEMWASNPWLKVGAAVLAVAVGVSAYSFLTKPNPAEDAKSVIRASGNTEDIKVLPGKGALDKVYTEAVQQKNQQRADTAAATGGSAIPTPINAAKEQGLPVPQQANTSAVDPLQEWKNNVAARRIKAEEANIDDDITAAATPPRPELVPMVQPVRPQVVQKADPQAAQALSGQMRTIITSQQPGKAKLVAVTVRKSKYDEMIAEQTAQKDQTSASSSDARRGDGRGGDRGIGRGEDEKAQEKVIIPAGHIIYAQLMTEMNSDIPAPALATVMSGPFTGGRIIGKMTKQDEYLVLTFERVIKDDVSYKVNAIALDEGTTLPALQTDVDHHYFSRIVLPAAAKFLTGYADSLSQTGTTTTVVSGGGAVQDQPKPDVKESIYKGMNEAASTVSDVMTEGAKKDITVRVARGATMGLLFLEPVTTGSVEK